jgi:hypothetical protein
MQTYDRYVDEWRTGHTLIELPILTSALKEVSGQFGNPAALPPREQPPVSSAQESGWAPQREGSLASAGNQTTIPRPSSPQSGRETRNILQKLDRKALRRAAIWKSKEEMTG